MVNTVPDAELPIIDAHHHLYPSNHWGDGPYLLSEFQKDLEDGHNVISTIYVECSQLYRETGPEHLRGAGEAEFAAVTGRLSDTGHFGATRVCEGFVGRADLDMGSAVEEVLAALDSASDGRLRGIRSPAIWDPDPGVNPSRRAFARQAIMAEPSFREGLARLADHGLVYDAWQFYPQLGELGDLAAAVPDATIVCGHCGGLIGTGGYSGPENFANWRARVLELAKRPNVFMKLGGLANSRTGFGLEKRPVRPDADELVELWSPYIETCIEAFGADRCLFESNFPVDQVAADYRTLWTVYKRITEHCSADEKAMLYAGTARRVYRLS
jgi:Predicted metal-dependent hydrolase of the TIM-barrel fold